MQVSSFTPATLNAHLILLDLIVPVWKIEQIRKLLIMQFPPTSIYFQSRDSSVGIALGYWLDDRASRVQFPATAGNFSLHRHVQNGSGAHPASYPMGTRGSFPGGKAAGHEAEH
jgi:hypothetical protein